MKATRVEVTNGDDTDRMRARGWLQCDEQDGVPSIDLEVDAVRVGGVPVDLGSRAIFPGNPFVNVDVSAGSSESGEADVVLEIRAVAREV